MMPSEGGEPASRFEEIACPLCGSQNHRLVHVVHDRLINSYLQLENRLQEPTYHIVACSSCSFLYLNPRPRRSFLAEYYQSEQYNPHQQSGGGLIGFLFRSLRSATNRWKAARVVADAPPGALLDVGSGTGDFLKYMRSRGWQVQGVESDPDAAAAAVREGITVSVGDPAEIELPERSFDLITCWHSLEHLPHLRGAVKAITAALRPRGTLAVAVPNPDSWDAKFYKSRWVAWDAPRHLYHFRRQDIVKLFETF
ncbi:MAG: class I SAM-dependent methyltransferase, partial [bacterium]